MNIEDKDHRLYTAVYGTPTMQLGCGGVSIMSVDNSEDGMAGISFALNDEFVIGKNFDEHKGKKVTDLGCVFQILATKRESLVVLRNKADEAIKIFDEMVSAGNSSQ